MFKLRTTLMTLAVALSAPRVATAFFVPSCLRPMQFQHRPMHTSPSLRMSTYDPEARLKELGIDLPSVAAAAANYVPYIVSGNYVYVAGQIPVLDGKIQFQVVTVISGMQPFGMPYSSASPEQRFLGEGTVPKDKAMDIAYQSARLCGLNIIAQVKDACGGDLKRVKKVVKLVGFVNSESTFTDQPKVINGASDLMVEVFGDIGRHARSAVGVNVLPLGVTTEVEAIIEISP